MVFTLYWFWVNHDLKRQNFLLLVASYIFYGWWDWRFLLLIFISSVFDYTIGLRMHGEENQSRRKVLLGLSLGLNLGILGFFKYFNFFAESFVAAFAAAGIKIHPSTLNIILPVGISFYTFQTLSYTIDIYKRQLKPTRDIIAFFAFVSFFPQLVAGPIERAGNLLPQFLSSRKFDSEKAKDGLRQILWGLFKKVCVADTCAKTVDYIFLNYEALSGPMLFVGIVFFAFQIYGDFSGYSDIAIGTARLFGFNLMRNFAYPYFSRDMAEFWRRWHISLSTWFRDYVYIPLGGSYGSKLKRIRNIIITFTISGFWHGANWTFIFWGFLNGIYYIPIMLSNRQKAHTEIVAQNRLLPSPKEVWQIIVTFLLSLLAWVFFRSENMSQAFGYLVGIFTNGIQSPSKDLLADPGSLTSGFGAILTLIVIEWIQRRRRHGLEVNAIPLFLRWSTYLIFSLVVVNYFNKETAFIYFQF